MLDKMKKQLYDLEKVRTELLSQITKTSNKINKDILCFKTTGQRADQAEFTKNRQDRKELIIKLHEINRQIKMVKEEVYNNRYFPNKFMKAAQKLLSHDDYEKILNEAKVL